MFLHFSNWRTPSNQANRYKLISYLFEGVGQCIENLDGISADGPNEPKNQFRVLDRIILSFSRIAHAGVMSCISSVLSFMVVSCRNQYASATLLLSPLPKPGKSCSVQPRGLSSLVRFSIRGENLSMASVKSCQSVAQIPLIAALPG